MENLHLMCAADLHLGRFVGSKDSLQAQDCVVLAWKNLIDACLDLHPKIDLLLLAGDIMDQEGLFLPMQGIFRRGIETLIDQGIQVIAIAGNHDPLILRQLEQAVARPEFCVLGKEGRWERKTFSIRGRSLHIDALSFVKNVMEENPLSHRTWDPVPQGDVLIGLLHCDVDASKNLYAPVRSSDFSGLPHCCWILGHIHIPQEIRPQHPWVQYCGSLQGLDPSESGARGAWRLSISQQGQAVKQFIPLAPLQWQRVVLDLSNASLCDWERQVVLQLEKALADQAVISESLREIAVRLRLEGRTEAFQEVRINLAKIQAMQGVVHKDGFLVPYWIESVANATRPAIDIAALSQGSDFLAALARKIKQVEDEPLLPPEIFAMLRAKIAADPFLKRCEQGWPGIEECRELYLSEGYRRLEDLLEQKR